MSVYVTMRCILKTNSIAVLYNHKNNVEASNYSCSEKSLLRFYSEFLYSHKMLCDAHHIPRHLNQLDSRIFSLKVLAIHILKDNVTVISLNTTQAE